MQVLPKNKYYEINKLLANVNINKLFAQAVIEKHVDGNIYVDNINNPSSYYFVHPYGMSLLFGKTTNENFNDAFKAYALNKNNVRNNHEWMQAYPHEWYSTIESLFANNLIKQKENINNIISGIIEIHTRVNFKFNEQNYLNSRKLLNLSGYDIRPCDGKLFYNMKGTVVPSKFWNNATDFFNNGKGYSLFIRNEMVTTAYSAFMVDNKLEIGIETIEKHQGKGYAKLICSKLIDHCLVNSLEPLWSCRKENFSSYKLAQKLGFEPTIEMPFYRLSK